MSKGVIATIVSLLIITGSVAGLYFVAQSDSIAPTVASATYNNETDVSYISFYDEEDADAINIETTEPVDNPQKTDSQQKFDLTTTHFNINKIIDHTINEQVQPRVVFGAYYNSTDYYIAFDSNGKFELKLNDTSSRCGKYTEYDDIVYVVYDDGTASEYDISRSQDGAISSIKVNYGDYDIYFS